MHWVISAINPIIPAALIPGETVHLNAYLSQVDLRCLESYDPTMKMTAEKIVIEAHGLSPQARAFVAEKLIESLDAAPADELSAEWRTEIQKRCREIEDGSAELRNASDVFDSAYALLSA